MNAQRSKRVERPGKETGPKLPPHSIEAEQGVLGCIFLSPGECLPKVREQFAGEQVFYDLRHNVIFYAACAAWDRGACDLITVQEELRSTKQIDQVGGLTYLAELPDKVPSAANLEFYTKILWEKFIARKALQDAQRISEAVMSQNGIDETLLGQMDRQHEEFKQKSVRGTLTPRHLKPAFEFAEEAAQHFYGAANNQQPGLDLPLRFGLKIRLRETTLLFGGDKTGKSTVVSFLIEHLVANPGQKACVASMEMPPAVSLWIFAAQLLGRKGYPETEASAREIADAMSWLNQRIVFYDFLGIANWKEILDTFRYSAEKDKTTLFVIDSVMRIGIADDDYAQQGFAATAFATFAKDNNAHLFYLIHENKGKGDGKQKMRGSALWSANADNIMRLERNEEKGSKIDKLTFQIAQENARGPQKDQEQIDDYELELGKVRRMWDTHIVLLAQRYPGSQQNASKFIWFDAQCFQFRDDFGAAAINWLSRWKGK